MEEMEGDSFSRSPSTKGDDNQLRQRKIISTAKEKLGTASRLIRKKIPCTGHLMSPRKLWIQMEPTRECDVCVMFPTGAQDSTLMWLLARLREGAPGLVVHVRHHTSTDSYAFYLTAPYKILLKTAEEYHLPKTIKKEFGGGLKEFVQSELSCFDSSDDENVFFTTQERQWLVLNLLQHLKAGSADVEEQTAGVKLREGQAIIPKFVSAGVILQVFPLHDLPGLGKLQKSWVRAVLEKQPIDEICEYFGVKIAMYFAWLGHYTTALIVPAFVGFLFWIGFCRGDQTTEDIGFIIFSLFNVLWASVYLETWKRYSSTLAYKWGTLDQRDELLVEPRPLFTGPLEVSPITNRLEPTYPTWKRYVFRYFVSVPVIILCLSVVFVIMIVMLQIQDWWDNLLTTRGYPFFLSYFPKILLAIAISVCDEVYYRIATWLNDMENYRVDAKYENHLIVKVALFQFVNSFLSLFYIAFYLQDLQKLKAQLAALLITRQVLGNIKESALPYLLEQFRLAKLSFDMFGALSPSEGDKDLPGSKQEDGGGSGETSFTRSRIGKRIIGQAELESSLFKYDGTFDDHLEMFIQLGYVALFSSAFPMAAFCALLNNLIEIRSDAFKLCFIFQRPFGQRVPNIGSWQSAMEVMGLIAILVNCALIGLSGPVHRMFPDMSTTQTILLIVTLEHVMLILKFVISHSIPDLPSWVATEMAKVEFARREAERRLSSTANSSAQDLNTNTGFVVAPSSNEETEAQVSQEEEVTVSQEQTSPSSTTTTPTKEEPPRSRAGSRTSSDSVTKPNKQKIHHEWLIAEDVASHHLTIGPHGGVDWVRRLALDKTRKTSEPEVGGGTSGQKKIGMGGGGGGLSSCRSTDCLPKDSSSSDSDLLRSAPPWTRSKFRFSPEKEERKCEQLASTPEPETKPTTPITPTTQLPVTPTGAGPGPAAGATPKLVDPAELAAKKQRVKQSLIKRARSVAIFSLKLKERRAREAKAIEQPPKPAPKPLPKEVVGGELGFVPLEMLIQVDDVAKDLQQRRSVNNS